MTSSNGKIFPVTGHLCGEFTSHRWIPHTKASDAEFWCFLLYTSEFKRLSKQSLGWWFETLSRPLWRHCDGHRCGRWCTSAQWCWAISMHKAVYKRCIIFNFLPVISYFTGDLSISRLNAKWSPRESMEVFIIRTDSLSWLSPAFDQLAGHFKWQLVPIRRSLRRSYGQHR